MEMFNRFCNLIDFKNSSKLDIAIYFLWFHSKFENLEEASSKQINGYFLQAHLPIYNITYLKRDLQKSKKVTKGSKSGIFKLARSTKQELDNLFSSLFEIEDIQITEIVNLNQTPFLIPTDIEAAHRMAELYIIIHCYENSVRRLIENVMTNAFSDLWWNKASSSGMITKYNDRKSKETKNKWLSPRGEKSPLYYLDWSDLVTIIRKFPTEFAFVINDIKFVELRFEELEKVRNIVAHNGTLPSEDDFQRVILSFKDWCKQVSQIKQLNSNSTSNNNH